ncbi:MAG: hypothetical protein ACSHWP_00190 [Pseudoalteromonas sp.]
MSSSTRFGVIDTWQIAHVNVAQNAHLLDDVVIYGAVFIDADFSVYFTHAFPTLTFSLSL